MTKSNLPTFDDIARMKLAELTALDIEVWHELQKTLTDAAKSLKVASTVLNNALSLVFENHAAQDFKVAGKDSGTVTFTVGAGALKATRAKTVEWDQAALAALHQRILKHGDDPAVYIKVSYDVSETAYRDWPADIQKTFEVARTVKVGATKFTVTMEKPT